MKDLGTTAALIILFALCLVLILIDLEQDKKLIKLTYRLDNVELVASSNADSLKKIDEEKVGNPYYSGR